MIVFSLGKLKIVFEFGFFVTISLFCLLENFGIAFLTFCACIIHEIGHIVASVIFNVRIEKVTFGFGGIKMLSEGKVTQTYKDIIILLSGPAINFLTAYFYFISENFTPFSVNMILGLFNLLPFTSLDGGAILRNIFEYFEINTSTIMKITAIIVSLVLCTLLIIFNIGNFAVYGIIIFMGICEIIY